MESLHGPFSPQDADKARDRTSPRTPLTSPLQMRLRKLQAIH